MDSVSGGNAWVDSYLEALVSGDYFVRERMEQQGASNECVVEKRKVRRGALFFSFLFFSLPRISSRLCLFSRTMGKKPSSFVRTDAVQSSMRSEPGGGLVDSMDDEDAAEEKKESK